MALQYSQVSGNRTRFVSLTGINQAQFEFLLGAFARQFAKRFDKKTLSGSKRKRARSDKKSNKLPGMENKLFFILTYVKTYPLQQVQAAMFDMTQPQCNVWIHLLLPILNDALDDLGLLPERQSKQVIKRQKGARQLIIDGTERPIQRPKLDKKQRANYSGKKKDIR